MSAGSLSATENDTYIDGPSRNFVTLNKFDKRHAIRVGKQFFNIFLIVNALRRSTLSNLYRTLKGFR